MREPAGVEGNTEFLKSNKGFSKIKHSGLMEIKGLLASKGIECRI